MDVRFLLLQICFFVSGFAALLYETVWTREFAFVFGTSELAVAAVLAAYMAGLAAGAGLAARLAPRLRRPVLVYGLFELGIALSALAVPWGTRAVMAIYVRLFGGLEAPPEALGLATALFHLAGAFAVLIPCTALMGATLPLLARHAVRSDEEIGPRIGLLYAVNTAGAIAGAITAAFLLLPEIGLRQTVYVGAIANLLVFGSAALLARRLPASEPTQPGRARGNHWILPLIAISGTISFGYEVLWTRLLGYLLGASTAAFATMLASFLLGIALGSALASRLARRREAAVTGFALAQLGTAVCAWGAFGLADRMPELAALVGASPEHLELGALVAVPMLLPFTLCIGASFPFAVRILAGARADAGPASARVYAWNTLGSIAGAIATGFLLLPILGFEGTLATGVIGNLALAGLTLTLGTTRRPRDTAAGPQPLARRAVLATAGLLLAGLLLAPPGIPERLLSLSVLSGEPFQGEIEYLGVGRSATVTLIDSGSEWRIATNGLPESAIQRPETPRSSYQSSRWLALLPVLARPDARRLLLIGLGGGNTLGAITPGLDSVDVIELEPEVVRANARIATLRRDGDPLADGRVRLRYGDARGSLLLADTRYDGVVSQPSHPWTSGASHLYTREFFEMVRSRLTPEGVFVQWIGRGFVDARLLRALLATLFDTFAYVELYEPENGALLMLSSRTPLDTLGSAARALAEAPQSFARVGIHNVEDVAAARVLEAEGVRALSRGAERITDDHNLLAFSAGKLGDPRQRRRQIRALVAGHDPLAADASRLDPQKLVRRLAARHHSDRALSLLAALPETQRDLARAWLQYDSGQRERSARSFRALLAENPEWMQARVGLACAHPREVDLDTLPAREADLVAGLRMAAKRDWTRLRGLDRRLASWRPGDLLFPEAARLRTRWRVGIGTPEQASEAIELIDPLLARGTGSHNYLLRAEAAVRARRPAFGWASLAPLASGLRHDPAAAEIARRALVIARDLDPTPGSAYILNGLRVMARAGRR